MSPIIFYLGTSFISGEALRSHAYDLAKELGVKVEITDRWFVNMNYLSQQRMGTLGVYRGRSLIELNRPVVDQIGYVTLLHELGHSQSSYVYPKHLLERQILSIPSEEIAAWQWAEDHAVIWNKEIEAFKAYCLATHGIVD